MKKINKRLAAIFLSLAISGMAAACGSNTDIGRDEAKRIALEDAGLSESDVTRLSVSKESDDGKAHYDVEFTNNSTEYDYEILAASGEIISSNIEKNSTMPIQANQAAAGNTNQSQTGSVDNNQTQSNPGDNSPAQSNPDDSSQTQTNPGNSSQAQTNPTGTQLTLEDAKKLALDKVPGATDLNITIKSDIDDGYYVYEGEIIYGQKEYDFEIDALTGTFLEWDEETLSTAYSNNGGQTRAVPAGTLLSLEDAKKLALDKVPGATDQNITIELEIDDGYYIYEGKIIYNQTEYEFEIDAATGTFLEWSTEQIYFHHDENNGHNNHDNHH